MGEPEIEDESSLFMSDDIEGRLDVDQFLKTLDVQQPVANRVACSVVAEEASIQGDLRAFKMSPEGLEVSLGIDPMILQDALQITHFKDVVISVDGRSVHSAVLEDAWTQSRMVSVDGGMLVFTLLAGISKKGGTR